MFECKQYKCGISLGVHSVLCRLVKYNNVVKQLGDVADLLVPQVGESFSIFVEPLVRFYQIFVELFGTSLDIGDY